MVNSNVNALGVIFANTYDNLVPELVAERSMGSIPFGGRYRLIDFTLSSMANAGIDNVSVIVRKNYHSLMDHLGAGREWDLTRKRGGLNIVPPFAERSVKLYSGRVDALDSILNWLEAQKERYVILSDSYIAMNFDFNKLIDAHVKSGADVTMVYNRAAIPVLEGIYMKAEGFNLTLTGYDMEMGITTTIECNVLVPGETVLDAKLLSAMVNRMPAGDVCIELNDEGQAKISGGVAEFEIPALNASDYPSLPVTGADNTMTMKCGVIREMIEKTIYAVSQDDKKPAHTGELFVIEPGSLTIVALDGYRLAIIRRDVECTRDIRIIIPAKTLQELLKIMGGADDDVKIDANRRYVVFTSNGYTIMSRLIEGDFLNYESVIPKDRKTRVTVECKSFIDTIERASLIITERLKNPLRISFAEDRVTVRCQTPLGKVVDEFAPVSMEGDAVEIGFNNRYLLDALRFSKCEKMVLEINGPLSPVKLLPEDGKDFIYLVLPVRFKNEG